MASLWSVWYEPDASISHAVTVTTINADDHPLMKRMHRPGDEKRSLVIVPPDFQVRWLNSSNSE